MQGRRSFSLPLFPCNIELERTLRQRRRTSRDPILTRTENTNPNERQPPEQPPFNHEQQPPPPQGELLMEFYLPTTFEVPSCIQFPNVAANQFEIKSSTINLLNSFHDLPNEDPYKHLDYFF